jgi:hypothetical protein
VIAKKTNWNQSERPLLDHLWDADHDGQKALKPEHQGHIDGMCAVYSVLNACKLLFDHSEKLDTQLFKALCEGIPDLFPKIVYDGTEVAGISRLLNAAKTWTEHIHKRELIWSQPTHHKTFATVEDYFAYVRSALNGSDGERQAAIVGLGKPWDHWTVVQRVGQRRAVFFDSWGFPRTTGFDYFTFDKEKAGEGDDEQTLLVYHQTFLLAAPPR